MIVVVMGVTGAGKTTVGERLAAALGAAFLDADDYHPPANRAKLAAGVPLSDGERWPWLGAVRTAWQASGGVLACSALNRAYRDFLLAGLPGPRVVFLHGPRDLVAARLAARRGHFAAPSILDSQLRELEPPADAIAVDIGRPPAAVVEEIVRALGVSCGPAPP